MGARIGLCLPVYCKSLFCMDLLGTVSDPLNSPRELDSDLSTSTTYKTWQNTCQGHIDTIRNTLTTELGLDSNTDFIEIPALFSNTVGTNRYVADMPGMVNMLVLPNSSATTIVIANPFGPKDMAGDDIFIKNVVQSLNWLNVEPVDDWKYYHALDGEVHCGTNVKRIPHSKNWWDH